ncbi:YceI family protein [Aquiflexum sp. LQ15W]|uniref:YceI family protein n=1 Tax=Cognataquiflexum nitidum TaxID=2922272 RepID=UPI001F13ABE3|nr:YceI family protein [Cognataquiflexum nitidum]MCH6201748.1 YceI family protein [Cognataquiflexum nitidum]
MSTATEKTTKWAIDPTHSEVSFKVKHLVISTVTGNFNSFEGGAESSSDDFQGAEISFAAHIASIDTNQSDRDNHLKSADFFDAEKYPKMTFSGILEGNSLIGELTIKDITKTVELTADFGGVVQDPYGQTKAGFELEGKISRKEFGLTWNAVTEAGSIVVSDQVRILANIQIVKQ